MPTPTQAEDLDISENPPQGPQSSAESPPSPQSNNHTPEPPQGGTPTPDEPRPHVEEFELELSDVDRTFIRWLKARVRRTRRLAQQQKPEKRLAPSLKTTFALLGLFATLLCAGLLVYQQIHIQEPTKKAAEESTAAAVASAAAAEWTTFMEWVLHVCPDELVRSSFLSPIPHGADVTEQQRNMSTPECLKAMNETIPPPPKPEYREARSIQHLFVRLLVPMINASHALESDILASDNYCGSEISGNLFTTTVNCSRAATSSFSERSLSGAKQLLTMSEFPLPSVKDVAWLNNLSARFPLAYQEFFMLVCYQLILFFAQTVMANRSRNLENRHTSWRIGISLSWALSLVYCGSMFINYTLVVSRAMAKDLYIQSCLYSQVIIATSP
jgi:hypothetical protein